MLLLAVLLQRQRQVADAKQCKAILALFASGVDYWQRPRHREHSWAMKEVVLALMLTRQRLDNAPVPEAQDRAAADPRGLPRPLRTPLPRLPEEMWLRACSFLRSADFAVREGVIYGML